MVKFNNQKIYIIDGAMGTEIQKRKLDSSHFLFNNINCEGFNDILSINAPDIIKSIHIDYINAGANIIETNTFNANYISAKDYGLSNNAIDLINYESARIAKECAKSSNNEVFVAGVLGPTSKTLSMSPDVTDPAYREISYKDLMLSYQASAKNLIKGGADIILIETIFDTLNAKAAIEAVRKISNAIPIMISGTIVDNSGRTLSGQTIEAFWESIRHSNPISVGLNCALGVKQMDPYIKRLSEICDCAISAHPNAGLPNEFGEYDQSPHDMSIEIKKWGMEGIVNVVGGCCGTSPKHIKLIANAVKNLKPKEIVNKETSLKLSGLESFDSKGKNFINIGERTNVTGSSKFKKCIVEKRYDDALNIAKSQIENGAQIIDINLDDGLLDSKKEMINFLKLVAGEPDIAKVPIMIDSSKWDILSEAMRWVQGKGIINSISLKEGEKDFLSKAKEIVSCGHSFIVMAFDEEGQADTFERKKEICERAYKLLVKNHIQPSDIIFDPNIFAIATGMEEHDNYAVDFINATQWIKSNLPGCKVSGGLSNLSFSFRGNLKIREMMHSVFLYHACKSGLDMAIVNAGQLIVYDTIKKEDKDVIEDAILNRHKNASNNLLELAKKISKNKSQKIKKEIKWRKFIVQDRITHSLVNGIDRYIEEDVIEIFSKNNNALSIVEGPLMDGMNIVGELFGAGKMFLPQVVKSARVMKKAVAWLEPYMLNDSKTSGKGKILMATVKGDVHDIGKNIVSVVLQCNGYEIIDLGVMVPLEKIISEAILNNVDAIGLSGLITPSLDEMVKIAKELNKRKLNIPLLIGGATTSKIHTAIKIANEYNKTVYISNASVAVGVISDILNKNNVFDRYNLEYQTIRDNREGRKREYISLKEARDNSYDLDIRVKEPNHLGLTKGKINIDKIVNYIDWSPFAITWGMKPKDLEKTDVGISLVSDAKKMIKSLCKRANIYYHISIDPCEKNIDDIIVKRGDEKITFNFLRQSNKKRGPNLSLVDFLHNKDWIGTFAICVAGIDEIAKKYKDNNDDYNTILVQSLGDRFAEAAAEWLHESVRKKWWGYSDENFTNQELIKEEYSGIRPAPGYPACPDHTQKIKILNWLKADKIKLTDGLTMTPKSAICGWYFANPESSYFGINNIPDEYISDLEKRNEYFSKYKNHLKGAN